MKKSLFILLAFFAIGLPSFAVITPDQAEDPAYLKNHGHSDEMGRLINLQKAQINGGDTTYHSKSAEWYTSKAPKILTPNRVSFVRRVFMYFDCGLDDEKFTQHNTGYTSKWNDNL